MGTNNGTLLNGATFAPAKADQAFSFTGNNECIQIPNAPNLVNSNYLLEARVKPLAPVSDGINQNVIFGQNYGQCLLVARTGSTGVRVGFGFGTSHVTVHFVGSTNEIPIGQFSHLAGTWNGPTLALYVNGVLNAQSTPGASSVDSGCPCYLGGLYTPTADSCSYVGQFFKGLIDEASCFNRALGAAEIEAIYNAGSVGKCEMPAITAQPHSVVGHWGKSVTFTVTAAGTAAPPYDNRNLKT